MAHQYTHESAMEDEESFGDLYFAAPPPAFRRAAPLTQPAPSQDLEFNPAQDLHKSIAVHTGHTVYHSLTPSKPATHQSHGVLLSSNSHRKQESAPAPVPTLPGYYPLEKYTHFEVSGPVSSIVDQFTRFLKTSNVDFSFNQTLFLWECSAASGACLAEFHARLWKKPTSGQMVIEFVHQLGDRAKVILLFKQCKAVFEGEEVPTQPLFRALSTDGFPLESIENSERDMVHHLCEMLASSRQDAVLQSARAFAELSSQESMRTALVDEGVVPALIRFLSEDHSRDFVDHVWLGSRLFSVTCLANISEHSDLSKSLYEASQLLLDLVADGTYQDRAMRREATRALRNLVQEEPSQVIPHVRMAQLAALGGAPLVDDRMRSDMQAIHSALHGSRVRLTVS